MWAKQSKALITKLHRRVAGNWPLILLPLNVLLIDKDQVWIVLVHSPPLTGASAQWQPFLAVRSPQRPALCVAAVSKILKNKTI